jgi:hypothetical protein
MGLPAQHGAFISSVDVFDAAAFGITPQASDDNAVVCSTALLDV